ncbi:ribosomal protein-like protein S15 [Cryomyces antarcticus]
MPPLIPRPSCLRTLNGSASQSPTISLAIRTFTSSSPVQASTVQQKRRHQDPYALAQSRARKAANLSRREVLTKERAAALGDPVRGITTSFVKSFDSALPSTPNPTKSAIFKPSRSTQPRPGPNAPEEDHLNYFLSPNELQSALQRSEVLSAPLPESSSSFEAAYTSTSSEFNFDRMGRPVQSPEEIKRAAEERKRLLEQQHTNATAAMARIASLANGSSKDRMRVNIQRCISTFGRHNTDSSLPPKAPSERQPNQVEVSPRPRIGPDIGSSEVQISILTAKIRTLADFLETRGKGDKVNKRNLRLLVHRRQKLLRYLTGKERGGPRWEFLCETLGLTEGTWKGEISM